MFFTLLTGCCLLALVATHTMPCLQPPLTSTHIKPYHPRHPCCSRPCILPPSDHTHSHMQEGNTALMRAALKGHVGVVQALLARVDIALNAVNQVGHGVAIS